jgi:hypothetical protein
MDVFYEAELQIGAVPSGAWDGDGDSCLVIILKQYGNQNYDKIKWLLT